MSLLKLRTILASACVAALCVAVSPSPQATGAADAPFQRFVARAPVDGDPGSLSRIDIMIERWSTDQEGDQLAAALSRGPEGLLTALQGLRRRVGVLLIPGVQGSGARARIRHPLNLYFARQIVTPKGRQMILAADHPLAFGQPTVKWPSEFEFSLLDVRFATDGTGVGKVAAAGRLAYNKETHSIEAANYDSLPARLLEMKSDQR
jgi:hypothetical protein